MHNYPKIVLGAIAGNLSGALLIFFYFAYIDLETFRSNKAFWRGSQADWTAFVIIMGSLSLLAGLLLIRHMAPLRRWSSAGGTPSRHIRYRAATLPQFVALLSLAVSALAGLIFAQGGLMFFSTTADVFWRTLVGIAGVGGLTTAALVFLLTEALWRPELCRLVHGEAAPPTGWLRITVGRRLAMTLLITGLVPLITLGVAARNGVLSLGTGELSLNDVIGQLQLTVLFIMLVGAASNLALSALATRSITQPLAHLTTAMHQVAGGHLHTRVSIESSDELGMLAANFNGMVAGLAQAQRMRDLFGRYVSPEVAETVLQKGADLGGELVEATVLFADIRNFTGLTERQPPDRVVDILNRYYTRMVNVIVAEGGLVNKFGGDSLLAVFGAPIRSGDHAVRAVRAAARMQAAMRAFNAEQHKLDLPPLAIGIGVATGSMIAGNVGGLERLEYTVIGDPVNLAARLQALTKELDAPILLSDKAYAQLGIYAQLATPLQTITVRGKSTPTAVYTIGRRTVPKATPVVAS
jgi:adenylate cyclase